MSHLTWDGHDLYEVLQTDARRSRSFHDFLGREAEQASRMGSTSVLCSVANEVQWGIETPLAVVGPSGSAFRSTQPVSPSSSSVSCTVSFVPVILELSRMMQDSLYAVGAALLCHDVMSGATLNGSCGETVLALLEGFVQAPGSHSGSAHPIFSWTWMLLSHVDPCPP